jgi:L-alanine-DL-glutamate epimerase-like enolase superfamily enzyme
LTTPETIAELSVLTARAQLPEVIHFGDWVMRHREFALVRLRGASGAEGFGFTLTREGPVAAAIRQAVAHHYVGASIGSTDDVEALFRRCQGANLGALASGVGLRGLSIVDLAAYDLLGKASGMSVARLLGGTPRSLPVTAIIGYPPGRMGPDEVRAQVESLRASGWRRFKIPIALPLEYGASRLLAAREAAGADAWLGMDGAWVFRAVDDALVFLDQVADAGLGWFEDVFPPGDAALVAELRERSNVPIAMGDEQGGSYYPEALLAANAVDVVRLDLTCMGGLTCARTLIDACDRAGTAYAPHMFAHVHSRVFGALGADVPIEWGVPGTGVDQYSDSLEQPVVREGMMDAPPEAPGFGELVNRDWLAEQDVDDPDRLLASTLS